MCKDGVFWILIGWLVFLNEVIHCYFNFQEAQAYADDNSLLFMETSAKTSMNVNEIFMAIGEFMNKWRT